VRRIHFHVAALLLAFVGQSCGGGSSVPSPTAPTALTTLSIVVSGWQQALQVGQSVQLTATAIFSDGSSRVVTGEAAWQSSNTAIATVQNGEVTAVSAGIVAISARFGDRSGEHGIAVAAPPLTGLSCGVERWAVKTLSDPAANQVELSRVVATTVKALNELPTHCSGLPNTRAFTEELVVYEVVGRIIYVRLEDDRDYHVAVEDPADSSYTIVTEVADSACAGAINSPHRDALAGARASFLALLAGRTPASLVGTNVRLRGVGFYDFNHGQIGRSRNCIELHPLTLVERAQ
jgi:Bacterial Ig-like domain (group 2)